jgi:hypothetical protein
MGAVKAKDNESQNGRSHRHNTSARHAKARTGETQEKQAEARQEYTIKRRKVAGIWSYTIDGPHPAVSDYRDIRAQWIKEKKDRKSGLAVGPMSIDTGSPEKAQGLE